MMNKKFLIISGDLLKHRFLCLVLLKKFNNLSTIIEEYPKKTSKNYTSQNNKIIDKHFDDLNKTDLKYFGDIVQKNSKFLNSKEIGRCKKGKINSKRISKIILNYNPDLIIICATSIINNELLNKFPNKFVNFHAGLCQYYRGAGCNVWAIYYKEIEKIGVTVHFVDSKLDTGNIIIQDRPNISSSDTIHTIGIKSYKLGFKLLTQTITFYEKKGYLPSKKQPQLKSLKICKKKNFTSKIVIAVNNLIKKDKLFKKKYLEKNIKLINCIK